MPRRSAASLAVVTIGNPPRLDVPPELGGIEADIFRATVASVPPDFFTSEDMVLLTAYCRCAGLERRSAEELQACAVVGDRPSPWLQVHAEAVRSLSTLTMRLRLGPRSRSNTTRSARKAASVHPSYYDQMVIGVK